MGLSMPFKDYYRVLGVNNTASPEEILKAYRNLTKQYHPDINPHPTSTAYLQEINEAYSVLKDPKKRATYDREFKDHFFTKESTFSASSGASSPKSDGKARSSTRTEYSGKSQKNAQTHNNSSLGDLISMIKTILAIVTFMYLAFVFVYNLLKRLKI